MIDVGARLSSILSVECQQRRAGRRTYDETSEPLLAVVGLLLVERHVDEVAIVLRRGPERETMVRHVAKVGLRIESGTRSQSLCTPASALQVRQRGEGTDEP